MLGVHGIMSIAVNHKKGFLERIREKFEASPPVRELLARIVGEKDKDITVTGLAGSAPAFMLAALAGVPEAGRPLVAIVSGIEEAEELYEDLTMVLGEKNVSLFPSLQTPPFEFRSPPGEIIGRRIAALGGLLKGNTSLVVAPIAAIIEPTMTLEAFGDSSLYLKTGDEVDIDDLGRKLVQMGFRRVPLVEEVGDFALRGGLIDFFSPGFDFPVRIEFFGDEIETIRQFEVASQRTTRRLDSVSLLPRREVAITENNIEQFIGTLPDDDADLIRARYLNDPELPGLEWLSLSFGQQAGCLTDYLPGEAVFCLEGKGNLEAIMDEIFIDAERHYDRIRERLTAPPRVEQYYGNRNKLEKCLAEHRTIDMVPFKGGRPEIIDIACREHPAFNSRLDLLATTLKSYQVEGLHYFIAADNQGQAERLRELLGEKIESLEAVPIDVARLNGGYICREYGYGILSDHQIFGRYARRIRRRKFKEGVAIHNYTSLTAGDYVVHTDFGIARYIGLVTIEVGGRRRDCLQLSYSSGDKLYVPIEEFNRVSKYSGKDTAPRLSALGGPGWEKVKARTKKAIVDMAADLIKIYAARKARPGYAFGPDTTWMRQLEASFPYDETTDQQKAIRDVKTDMESETPMDRLVCGDVGYGKTEVAVRAAFKAVEEGKQVAILVPTTILAQQHLTTFRERLADFPIRIDMLSRFRTRKEQKEIIKDLAENKIEIVIGTHRLLSKDVQFADLGLLIIDEEQRFGVRHKEKLRKIRATVDTLTLTATPIPRTLQMSLTGARDMSLINTSPKDRHPIYTHISEFNPEVIAEAILREVDRGGQIFFVHNRIQSIEAIYKYLKKLVPQVAIAVAHGQMHEKSLEGIMLAFLAGKFQVLLSTSIIESGLDIPSVNTIIINRADRFGLAQLYQLRGRVGRSSVRARAYLLTPTFRLLSADARKRLRAIEAHSDLGSGFALAMKDLEIRGAGNMLGSQQSGFIEEVGFDLYTRMLEEAVAELKGEKIVGPPDTKLEIDIEILIPDYYIDIHQQKVEIYQRIAGARTLDEVERIRNDMEDRFGRAPAEVNNLFEAAAVRISAWAHEIEKVRLRRGRGELIFGDGKKWERREIENWRRVIEYPVEFSMTAVVSMRIDLSRLAKDRRLGYLRAVLNRV